MVQIIDTLCIRIMYIKAYQPGLFYDFNRLGWKPLQLSVWLSQSAREKKILSQTAHWYKVWLQYLAMALEEVADDSDLRQGNHLFVAL